MARHYARHAIVARVWAAAEVSILTHTAAAAVDAAPSPADMHAMATALEEGAGASVASDALESALIGKHLKGLVRHAVFE